MNKNLIDEIRAKLHAGKMSALIGAGFSKNAHKDYPSWDGLLTDIIKDLYLRDCDENVIDIKIKQIIEEKGYLPIVDEYIKREGDRKAIDKYIEEKIGKIDKENHNLDMHKQLLELPWNNIYTTNYDKTLEKANEQLGGKYTVVQNSTKLSIKPTQRIIKLHGTLRDDKFGFDGNYHHPYIISTEDYENYPQEHDAFTYLMRIALLQESFCLLGFSGSDPNFLEWIKWVKDILDRKRKENDKNDDYKVYLIDVSKDEPEKSKMLFFKNHNIAYVSLHQNYPNDPSVENKIKKFLTDIRINDNDMVLQYHSLNMIKLSKQYKSILSDLMKNNKKDFMYLCKIYPEIKKYDENLRLPPQKALKYDFQEIVYRYKKSLITTLESISKNEEKISILGVYTFFIRNAFIQLSHVFDDQSLNKIIDIFNNCDYVDLPPEKQKFWFEFAFLLLSNYRFQLMEDEFELLKKKIESKLPCNDDAKNRIAFETGLFYTTTLQLDKLEKFLSGWNPETTGDTPVHWLSKKAYLLSFFNNDEHLQKARKLLWIIKNNVKSESEKLWHLELLSYYEMVFRLPQNENLTYEINQLKLKGFYTIESLVECLLPRSRDEKIVPFEYTRYRMNTVIPIGQTKEESEYWNSIQLLEFLHEAAIPVYLPRIIFINKSDWEKVFTYTFIDYPQILVSYLYRYSCWNHDFENNLGKALFQRLLYNKDISNEIKIELYNSLYTIFHYYLSHNIIFRFFIQVLPYFARVLDSKIWQPFLKKLWSNNNKNDLFKNILLEQKMFLNSSIRKTIIYIDNSELINMIIKNIIHENDSNKFDLAFNYLSVILRESQRKEAIDQLLIDTYIKSVLALKEIQWYDINRLGLFFSENIISEDIIKKIVITIKKQDLSKLIQAHADTILFLVYLSKCDEEIEISIKKIILQNNPFPTGIFNNGRARKYGGKFSLLNISFTPVKGWGLHWTQTEFKTLFNNLEESWNKCKQYYTLSSFESQISIESEKEMYVFLLSYKDQLKHLPKFNTIFLEIKQYINKRNGFTTIEEALYSMDSDKYRTGLHELYSEIQKNPIKDNSSLLYIILTRILMKEPANLEYSIEIAASIFIHFLKDKDWIFSIMPGYSKILDYYASDIPQNMDSLHIHKWLILMAMKMRKNWPEENKELIDNWMEIKNKSPFYEIKTLNLK